MNQRDRRTDVHRATGKDALTHSVVKSTPETMGLGTTSQPCLCGRRTTRLPTANRSHVSINVTKFWPGPGALATVQIFFFLSSLITMQNFLAVRHTVWAYIGGPENWRTGVLGPRFLRIEVVSDPLESRISTCVTILNLVVLGQPYGPR